VLRIHPALRFPARRRDGFQRSVTPNTHEFEIVERIAAAHDTVNDMTAVPTFADWHAARLAHAAISVIDLAA
jgi:hypothetical protein